MSRQVLTYPDIPAVLTPTAADLKYLPLTGGQLTGNLGVGVAPSGGATTRVVEVRGVGGSASARFGQFSPGLDAVFGFNLSYDGSAWNRDDTTKTGIAVQLTTSAFNVYTTPVGANPAPLTNRLTVTNQGVVSQTADSGVSYAYVRNRGGTRQYNCGPNGLIEEVWMEDVGTHTNGYYWQLDPGGNLTLVGRYNNADRVITSFNRNYGTMSLKSQGGATALLVQGGGSVFEYPYAVNTVSPTGVPGLIVDCRVGNVYNGAVQARLGIVPYSDGRTALISENGPLNLYAAGGFVQPLSDNSFYFGTSLNRWYQMYSTNGVVTGSSREIKEITGTMDDAQALSQLMSLPAIYRFHYKRNEDGGMVTDTSKEFVGPVAEEMPADMKVGEVETGSVNTEGHLMASLRGSVKEHRAQIAALMKRIEALEAARV